MPKPRLHTREARASDAAQLLENVSWVRNAPNESEDSIRDLIAEPDNITLINEETKATILFRVDVHKRDVHIVWWLGPPEVRFLHEKEVLAEAIKVIFERWGRRALSWNIGGASPDDALASRWVAELRGTDDRTLVQTKPLEENLSYTYAWSTVGEMAEALGVDVG